MTKVIFPNTDPALSIPKGRPFRVDDCFKKEAGVMRRQLTFLGGSGTALALALMSVAYACTISIWGQTVVTDPADVYDNPDPVGALNTELNDIPGTLAVTTGNLTFKARADGVTGGTWKLYVRQHPAPVPDSVPPMNPATTDWTCMGLASLPGIGDDAVSGSVTATSSGIPETTGTLPATDGGLGDDLYDSVSKHRGLVAVCFMTLDRMEGTEFDVLSII